MFKLIVCNCFRFVDVFFVSIVYNFQNIYIRSTEYNFVIVYLNGKTSPSKTHGTPKAVNIARRYISTNGRTLVSLGNVDGLYENTESSNFILAYILKRAQTTALANSALVESIRFPRILISPMTTKLVTNVITPTISCKKINIGDLLT